MSGTTTTSHLPSCVAARNEEDMKARFEDWMKEYDKTYRDEEEKAMRFQLFKATVKDIESQPPSYRNMLEPGYFADFKDEDLPSSRSCVKVDESEVYCENEKGLFFCNLFILIYMMHMLAWFM